ncbi:unnamed protein product [Caenorhabditis nigoni]
MFAMYRNQRRTPVELRKDGRGFLRRSSVKSILEEEDMWQDGEMDGGMEFRMDKGHAVVERDKGDWREGGRTVVRRPV